MKVVDVLAALLLWIGGLNWGCWGIFRVDVIAKLLAHGDNGAFLSRLAYSLVGIAAVYLIVSVKSIWGRWRSRPAVP